MRTWIGALVLVAAVTACGGEADLATGGQEEGGGVEQQDSEQAPGDDGAGSVPTEREDRLRPTPAPTPRDLVPGSEASPGEGSAAAVPEDLLDAVLADAAERSGLARDRIEVERAAAVTWSDGGLGCPEPGMQYTQQLIDGHWILLRAGGEQLDYRADGRGAFRLCEGGGSGPVGNPVG